MRGFHQTTVRFAILACLMAVATAAGATLTSAPTAWSNFTGANGYIVPYTYNGAAIADYEGSQDPSNGGTGVEPSAIDLASGSPTGSYPGLYETPAFGYYNGGTVYDPDDPVTYMDDFIFFRMRLQANPAKSNGFEQYHWNVLLDVDRDGYKEYWVDCDGTYTANGAYDMLRILYNNDNTQLVTDPVASEVEVFRANNSDAASYTHTRSYLSADGSGQYVLEIQVPIIAFVDLQGNQVLLPSSPVGFVFSTGASNQDPLQKDWMMDLEYLGSNQPIRFGDYVRPDGEPDIRFTDATLKDVYFYSVGDQIYIVDNYKMGNTHSDQLDTITVTVTSPITGDDQVMTLVETGINTGLFTNRGAATLPVSSAPTEAWIPTVITSASVATTDWRVVYSGGVWTAQELVSGVWTDRGTVTPEAAFTSSDGDVTFTLYADRPAAGTTITFSTIAASPLPTVASDGTMNNSDGNGSLEVVSGEPIYVSHTTPQSNTYTDTADIVGVGAPYIQFTRANGLPSQGFELNTDSALSDPLYVTVYHTAANSNPAVAETITVTLSGADGQTITLTETGPNTGIFRNTTGLATKVSDGTVTSGDNLWEDNDGGEVTASYTYGGTTYTTTAELFYTDYAGSVRFTNGAGTLDVETYAAGQPVFIRLEDENWVECDATPGVQVTVTSDTGDSEVLTLVETATGSYVFMNRVNDLSTTIGSSAVTSASSTFITSGVQVGDRFAIATGPDAGLYTVTAVNSQTQLTLDTTMTATRTGLGFNASPLITATYDGSWVANDGVIEADDQDSLTVTYDDCNDGDLSAANNIKDDTAVYNNPPLVINEVCFYPRSGYGETEYFVIYNNSAVNQDITGYTVTDGDGYTYTFPQVGGSNIVLAPGESAVVFLMASDLSSRNYFQDGSYYLFAAGNGFPSDLLGDPMSANPADQLTLATAGGSVIDYVGWSSTTDPVIMGTDFLGDDGDAVSADIWQDDAYRSVTGIVQGTSLIRIADGYDTNQPSDWTYVTPSIWGYATTQALVASFSAAVDRGRVVVLWDTAGQAGTIGFRLHRIGPAGERIAVGDRFLPAVIEAAQGASYRMTDPGARSGHRLVYVLEELDAYGSSTEHGPFEVTAVAAAPPAADGGAARMQTETEKARAPRRTDARARRLASQWMRLGQGAPGSALAIGVPAPGIWRIAGADIAAGLRLPASRVRGLIARGQLSLTLRGRPVAVTPDQGNDAILFFAPPGTGRKGDDVYLLRQEEGPVMGTLTTTAPGNAPSPASAFRSRAIAEEDRTPAPAYVTEPGEDLWLWEYLFAGYEGYDTKDFPIGVPSPSPTGDDARLLVAFKGASNASPGHDHHLKVSFNGVPVGEVLLDGTASSTASFPVPSAVLAQAGARGGNRVTVKAVLDRGIPGSVLFVDSLALDYDRLYRAEGDTLAFTTEAGVSVVVSGFTSPEIVVLETGSADSPRILEATRVRRVAGGRFAVSFTPPAGSGSFFAQTRPAIRTVEDVRAVAPSSLVERSNRADLVIITPEDFLNDVSPLADYRRGQRLEVTVAGVEEIANHFNHGYPGPAGIARFLSHAARFWAKAPRYVLLAGDGSYDYGDVLGYGGNLILPLMATTPFGTYASDGLLADLDGDRIPEMAVGRLPFSTREELAGIIAKIIAWESSPAGSWDAAAVVLSDNPDVAGDFPAQGDAVAAIFPADYRIDRISLGRTSLSAARKELLASLRAGRNYLNYAGHGGADRLAQEGLLTKGDVAVTTGAPISPILSAMTCVAGQFAFPGFDSIGETFALSPAGGAIAVWAPSGLSVDPEAATLNLLFSQALFSGGNTRLGDAILGASRAFGAAGGDVNLLAVYNLLGDPTLRLRR